MSGSVQSVIACLPSTDTVSPCPSGTAPAVINAYLLEPSAQAQIEASFAPVDFAQASSFWAIAFVTVIFFWSLALLFSHSRRAIR